jgi:hypothetical protein
LVFCLAVASAYFGCRWRNNSQKTTSKATILAIWVVGVPTWFAVEYFYIYPKYALAYCDFDHFKYGQDVATKAWLAVVTILTALYFGKDIQFFASQDKSVKKDGNGTEPPKSSTDRNSN